MIKIEYVCHACLLININGKKILTDPWIMGSCFANCLWIYPPPKKNAAEIGKVDYIYFSHGHEDHFQIESINEILKKNRNTKVIIPSSKNNWFFRTVKKVGFKNVISLEHNMEFKINENDSFKLFINDQGEFDSSLLIKSNKDEVFIQTDNIMSEKESKRIGKENNIFASFLMPYATGIFPGLYDFKIDIMRKLAKNKEDKSLRYLAQLAKNLNSKLNIPYANDLCYFADLYYLNHLHSFDKNNVKKFLNQKKINSLIMQPGDMIFLKNRKLIKKVINQVKIDRIKDLSFYTKSMEKLYNQRKYEEIHFSKKKFTKSFQIFKNKIDQIKKNWKFGNFKAEWKIKTKEKNLYFNHCINAKNIKSEADIKIEIDDYRIQNLVEKFYPMRFLSFHNGGIKIKRKTSYLTNKEKFYFDHLESMTF